MDSDKKQVKNGDKQGQFYRREISHGSFPRSFALPMDADADKIGAEFKDGILTIEVTKPESRSRSPSIDPTAAPEMLRCRSLSHLHLITLSIQSSGKIFSSARPRFTNPNSVLFFRLTLR